MSFTGLVAELPIGQDGLTGSKNAARILPSHLLQADNVNYFGDTLSKEGGASKYNATVITDAPSIQGGWDWWPTVTNQRMIVATGNGKLLKDSGAGTFPVTLKTGMTINPSDIINFIEGGKEAAAGDRKLFILSPSNQMQVLAADGATTANVATPATDWATNFPRFGNAHDGRIWAGGNLNDPYRLYYSERTNHEVFQGGTAGSLSIFPGEGEYNVGVVSFKGLQLVFRYPVGIYAVDTQDATIANWTINKLSTKIGAAGSGAIWPLEDDVMFMDVQGNLQLLSGITEFGNLGMRSASTETNIQTYIKENFNLAQIQRIRGVLYAKKREVHIAIPGTGSTVNNRRLVVDLNRPGQLRFRSSSRDVCESLWLRRNTGGVYILTSGDDAGFVWDMDQDTKSKDGAGYNAEWQSSHDDLSWLEPSLATVRKSGKYLELVIEPLGNWNLGVDVIWDGKLHQSVNFNMGVTGAALGSFELGTDILGNSPIGNRKRRIGGSGRRLSLRGSNSGAGQDYSILRFLLHFKKSSQRLESET